MSPLRNLLIAALITLAACNNDYVDATSQFFYYYNDDKIYLFEDHSIAFVRISKQNAEETMTRLSVLPGSMIKDVAESGEYLVAKVILGKPPGGSTSLTAVRSIAGVETANYMLRHRTSLLGYTDEFIARLADDTSIDDFEAFMDEHGVRIKEVNNHVARQYLLAMSNTSRYTYFQVVNRLYESGLVQFSEPNFYFSQTLN